MNPGKQQHNMPKSLTLELNAADLEKDHPCADAHRIRILEVIDELLVSNADDIKRALKNSSKSIRTVAIAVKIDTSSGLPEMTVKTTIAQEAKRDSRNIAAEDPDQLPFQIEHRAADPEPTEDKPKGKKAKK